MTLQAIKRSETFQKLLEALKEQNNTLDRIFNPKEVRYLTSAMKNLGMKGMSLKNSKSFDDLQEHLLQISAFFERLTVIKSEVLILVANIRDLRDRTRRYLLKQRFFKDLKRGEKTSTLDEALGKFIALRERAGQYLLVIDNALNHLDKLQFNVKTILALERQKLEAYHGQAQRPGKKGSRYSD